MKIRYIATVIGILILIPTALGSWNADYDYQYIIYEITDNQVIGTNEITYQNNPPGRCFLGEIGANKSESFYRDLDPSSIKVMVNGESIPYINKDLLLDESQKNIEKGFSFYEPCDERLLGDIKYQNFKTLCKDNAFTNKGLLILNQEVSKYCNIKIEFSTPLPVNMIENEFFQKKFTSSFIPIRGHGPLILQIKIPEKTIIVDYNEQNSAKTNENEIKWIFTNRSDGVKVWVKYMPSLSLIIDKVYENNFVRIILFLLSFQGLISLFQKIKTLPKS